MSKNSQHSERILLLEDEPMVQIIHGRYLEDFGFFYDLAKTGKEAIALYSRNKYTLMLLDKQLPDMDSTKFCQLVRSEYTKNELPIIILTACGSTAKKECLQAGCNEFFVKPVDKDILGKAIKQWISLSKNTLSNRFFFGTCNRSVKNVDINETGGRDFNYREGW